LKDPTELLAAPKLKKALPDTLTFEEIEQIISQIDLSKPEGMRNKALLETLYSCGMRVSEIIQLKKIQPLFRHWICKGNWKGRQGKIDPHRGRCSQIPPAIFARSKSAC